MKISVITATWNSEKTIADTIASVRQQCHDDIEYIVVDGGSSDATLDILKANDDCIDYLVSEKDRGIYDALNKGIAAATGDVIGFLHSDDIYACDDALTQIADKFITENVDSVYGDLNYVSKDNVQNIVRHWKSSTYSRSNILQGWMPPHPTFYMKRALYQQLGGFDLSFKIAADYDSILRYFWVNNISSAYVSKVLINMRVGGESNRSIKNIMHKSQEDCRALKNNNVPMLKAIIGKNISKIPQFFKSNK